MESKNERRAKMLPKQILVKECRDSDTKYLYATDSIDDSFENNDKIGIYELKDTKMVSVRRELKLK